MEGATASSGLAAAERGAGGKFRKPPARKPPSTPYDRPPPAANQSQAAHRRDGGWLSKLVHPARRLISSGAARIVPSLFSRHPPRLEAAPASNAGDRELNDNASADDKTCTINLRTSTFAGVEGPSKAADKSKCNTDLDDHRENKAGSLSDDGRLREIEQMLKGKKFSREEIDRLTEILHSKVVDPSNVQQEKNNPTMDAGAQAEGILVAQESQKWTAEKKQEDLNRAIWGTSTPLPQKINEDEVGASPVEIARAYMGTRVLDIGLGPKSTISKDDKALLHGDEFASMTFVPSPLPKSSICWPGAMVQEQSGYLTPRNPRVRFGLHNLPRTPYSRTIYSKSKGKGDSSRYPDILSTPSQQLRTPTYGLAKSRTDALNESYGSGGPIRRIGHKFVSETHRGSVSFHSTQNGPPQVGYSTASEEFLPAIKNQLDFGATRSTSKIQSVDGAPDSLEGGVATVHPQSSQLARRILEHIDRNIPTPKEKLAELSLATRWRKPPSSEITTLVPEECNTSMQLGASDSYKNTGQVDPKFSAKGNKDRGNSLSKIHERSSASSGEVLRDADTACWGNAGPSLDFKETGDSQFNSSNEVTLLGFDGSRRKEKSQLWPLHNQINGHDASKVVPSVGGRGILNRQNRPPLNSSGARPDLAISINKPGQRFAGSSDNNLGFTFPVSASPDVFSEPPTPSITPSFSASGLPRPEEKNDTPSYSFGVGRSTPRLVFSFPSTSDTPTHNDASDLKFNFGSDKKARVSFSPVGKNAVCY
ncbi:nuclear pore complex protein NUP1 [Malania oleifera]|uniref:nuclear pore complex protein NUP1 n=1 Tax=Malania oleifera TaxID=397392 RepID=UPI0025AE9B60|nr:nuclear pore complex protein NUP1 [Malania oleifera]